MLGTNICGYLRTGPSCPVSSFFVASSDDEASSLKRLVLCKLCPMPVGAPDTALGCHQDPKCNGSHLLRSETVSEVPPDLKQLPKKWLIYCKGSEYLHPRRLIRKHWLFSSNGVFLGRSYHSRQPDSALRAVILFPEKQMPLMTVCHLNHRWKMDDQACSFSFEPADLCQESETAALAQPC